MTATRPRSSKAVSLLLLALLASGCLPFPARHTPIADVDLFARAEEHLEEARKHLLPEGLLVYRLDWPDTLEKRYRRARRQADGAYFQGLYTAALAQRAALMKTQKARKEALQAYRALHRLMALSGYEGLVARTFGKDRPDDEAYVVRDDASGDQVTGFVWGTWWALKALGEEAVGRDASGDMKALVAHLVRHEGKIHRRPDEPTKYGDYDADVAGVVPVGHRAVGALAVALVARFAAPDDPACKAFFDRLVQKDYHRKAAWFYPWLPHSAANTVNYLLNLYLVRTLDESPHRRRFYDEGRDSAWTLSHDWQMPFYASLFKALGGSGPPEELDDTLQRLANLPARHTWFRDEEVHWRSRVVPLEKRPSTTSYWSKSPRKELTGHAGVEEPVRIARIDYLVAFWFGRWHGHYGSD